MPETVTSPDGVVHNLAANRHTTVCGQNADGWSRAVTIAELAGLVIKCEMCNA